jgi:hypothetical protein
VYFHAKGSGISPTWIYCNKIRVESPTSTRTGLLLAIKYSETRWINITQRTVQRICISIQALGIGKIIASHVWVGTEHASLDRGVLAEGSVFAGGFGVMVEHSEMGFVGISPA